MTAPTKYSLGQKTRLDLIALAIEAGVAAPEALSLHLGALSKDQLVGELTRTGPLAKLTERSEKRLEL